jgi:heat shock protein HspQ
MPEKKRFKFKVGDIVKTHNFDNVGVISEVYKACPQSNHWLSIQEIPVLAESIRKPWYSINCIPDGAVVVPEYDMELIKRTEYNKKQK